MIASWACRGFGVGVAPGYAEKAHAHRPGGVGVADLVADARDGFRGEAGGPQQLAELERLPNRLVRQCRCWNSARVSAPSTARAASRVLEVRSARAKPSSCRRRRVASAPGKGGWRRCAQTSAGACPPRGWAPSRSARPGGPSLPARHAADALRVFAGEAAKAVLRCRFVETDAEGVEGVGEGAVEVEDDELAGHGGGVGCGGAGRKDRCFCGQRQPGPKGGR